MNTSSSKFNLRAAWVLACALAMAAVAQDTPAAPEKPTPPPAPAGSAATDPAATTTAAPATTPVETSPTEETAPAEKKGGLRRIDTPAGETIPRGEGRRSGGRNRASNSGEFPIGDHLVPKGGEMHDAVSILGSTTVEGRVLSDAVSVLGNTTVGPDARIGGAAVAVLGRLKVDGEVKGEAVSVLGGATINGKVGAEVVSVLGDLQLGPNAEIGGDIVLVGGKLTKDPSAIVHGNEVNVPVFGGVGSVEWFVVWVKECALKGRLLAFAPRLGWAWTVAFSFFAFYLLLAAVFGRPIEKCAMTFETRPGASVLSSVLTVLLSPVVTILLVVTVVGGLLVPFVAAGLFFAGLFGKAVMLAWIGRRFTKFFGSGPLSHPFFAVLIGGIIVMLLYTVWGSILLYKLLSWLGLGVVVLTIAQSIKREKPPLAAAGAAVSPEYVPPMDAATAPFVPVATGTTPTSASVAPSSGPAVSAGFAGGATSAPVTASGVESGFGGTGFAANPPPPAYTPPTATPPPVVPPVASAPRAFAPRPPTISAATLPRVGFFLRLAAMALDGILIGMLVGFTSSLLPRILQFNHGPGGVLLALAIYGAVMWKTKGTTIGGIVCGLKVVRIDHRPIDWATAIVRALGCFLSLVVAGLGFIWVAFDDEKQSWHDKIAGTTVVRVPKGVSLL